MMYEWHDSWGWMVVGMLLVTGVIVALGLLIRRTVDERQLTRVDGSEVSRARSILTARFARGEIDEEEFKRRGTLLDH